MIITISKFICHFLEKFENFQGFGGEASPFPRLLGGANAKWKLL